MSCYCLGTDEYVLCDMGYNQAFAETYGYPHVVDEPLELGDFAVAGTRWVEVFLRKDMSFRHHPRLRPDGKAGPARDPCPCD